MIWPVCGQCVGQQRTPLNSKASWFVGQLLVVSGSHSHLHRHRFAWMHILKHSHPHTFVLTLYALLLVNGILEGRVFWISHHYFKHNQKETDIDRPICSVASIDCGRASACVFLLLLLLFIVVMPFKWTDRPTGVVITPPTFPSVYCRLFLSIEQENKAGHALR